MIEKYYEEELRYLYDSGKEFARAHPDRAQFLNIDAVGDRDPYIERLFEGFAFLAGRIREKLDDSFPELTEGLINLLWPHFHHTIPSLTIIELLRKAGAEVFYNDPYFPRVGRGRHYDLNMSCTPLENLGQYDAVLIVTDHSSYDYAHIVAESQLVVDSRNATRGIRAENI